MRRLLLCRRGWSSSGGAERFIQRFREGLADMGVEIILISDDRWPEVAWKGGIIERVSGETPEAFANGVATVRSRYPGVMLFSMERVPGADVFRAGDGIHTAWLSRLAAQEGRLQGFIRRFRKIHRQLPALERRLFADPKLRVIVNSRMVADELRRIHVFPAERMAVVHNGFDAPELSDVERCEKRRRIRSNYQIPPDAKVYLFVGSGWKRKGVASLVQAFTKLGCADTHLILVGKGRSAGTNHPRIHLAGVVADPADHYLAADVFVLPTLYDPFSNACLEAAALGLPVITSDANGFSDVLEAYPEAGEVLPVSCGAGAWCSALERWADPALRDRARNALLKIRSHFTVSRNVADTLSFIQLKKNE
jgi:UDP-glucose:(heptosyl)LPS alpha-1,3-glucosyltransferase